VTVETENLILEMLRDICGTADRLERDVGNLRVRMSAVEYSLGRHQMQFAALITRLDRSDERLARIERRLSVANA
jgi:hypothetical protein